MKTFGGALLDSGVKEKDQFQQYRCGYDDYQMALKMMKMEVREQIVELSLFCLLVLCRQNKVIRLSISPEPSLITEYFSMRLSRRRDD